MKLYALNSLKLAVVPSLCQPTDIAGCVFWLRASAGVVTTGTHGRVKSWADQVGHVALTPIDPKRAPVSLDYVAALNGLPGIGFFENTQMLQKVGGIDLPFGDAPFSMFAVCSPENAGEVNAMIALWSGTMPHAGLRFSSAGEFQAWAESLYDSGNYPHQFAPHVIGIVFDGVATLKLYVDGALVETHGGLDLAAQNDGDDAVLAIGADTSNSEGFRGHLGDVVIYDRALAADEVHYLTVALHAHYKMRTGWLGSIWKLVTGLVAWPVRLLGSELRHLFKADSSPVDRLPHA